MALTHRTATDTALVLSKDTHPTLARREVLGLLREIREDLGALARTFWEIGVKARRLRDEKGHAALGYASFDECVEAELGVSMRQLRKMLAVVHWFGREDATAIGFERAAALITYSRVVDVDPGTIVREDAPVDGVPVSQASVRHIKQAALTARKERRAHSRTAAAKAVAREEKALVAHVRQAIGQAALGRGHVTIVGKEVVVRFAVKALARHLRK